MTLPPYFLRIAIGMGRPYHPAMNNHRHIHPDPRKGANDGCLACYDRLPEPTHRRDVSGPSDSPDSRVGTVAR